MASNAYHFITHWQVEGGIDEVFEVLGNGLDLARWWPSVYLVVNELEPGDARGVGKVVDLYTKGWLPYTLRWRFRITDVDRPQGFSLEAQGDFVGRGVWKFAQNGPAVDVTYDWNIQANKTLLRRLSFIMKPIFGANHRWAMGMGEKSLKLELTRRHAATPEAKAQVPPPPLPTPMARFLVVGLLGLGAVTGVLYGLARALAALIAR